MGNEFETESGSLNVGAMQAELDSRYSSSDSTTDPVVEEKEEIIQSPNQPEPTTVAPTVNAPNTWRPEASKHFATLPPEVQQEVLKREEDMFKGIEQYKTDANFGKNIGQVMAPYMETLQKYGVQPEAQIADMMQAHYTLAFGSNDQKVQLLQQIAKDYGVNLGQSDEYIDPQVQGLQGQIGQLQHQLKSMQLHQQNERMQQINQEVSAFQQDPANIYFDELADDMANLLRTGACKTLKQAYETSLWANPTVRAKEMSRQEAERKETASKEEAARVGAAKAATAANLKLKSKPGGSAATPTGSMRDTIQETLDSIYSRVG